MKHGSEKKYLITRIFVENLFKKGPFHQPFDFSLWFSKVKVTFEDSVVGGDHGGVAEWFQDHGRHTVYRRNEEHRVIQW